MTNEKRELFATLGLIAAETVANESVNTELKPEVELTALESIESELKDLDEIDKSYDEAEKASFESMISDLELLNSVLAYKSVKTAGAEEAALESISAEFGISTEGIKELAEKGVDAIKTLIDKIISVCKKIFGSSRAQEKVVKSLLYKLENANKDGKYDLKKFSEILGKEMILGGVMRYGYSDKDFPSDDIFKNIIDTANSAIETFYKKSLDKNDKLSSLFLDMTLVTTSIHDIEKIAKKVKSSQDFDYYNNIIKLAVCFKAYNVGKYIKDLVAVFEEHKNTLDKGGKLDFESKVTSEDLSQTLTVVNYLMRQNSANVRAFVKLCGEYIKSAKDKPTEEKSA